MTSMPASCRGCQHVPAGHATPASSTLLCGRAEMELTSAMWPAGLPACAGRRRMSSSTGKTVLSVPATHGSSRQQPHEPLCMQATASSVPRLQRGLCTCAGMLSGAVPWGTTTDHSLPHTPCRFTAVTARRPSASSRSHARTPAPGTRAKLGTGACAPTTPAIPCQQRCPAS